mmetsp:Transcript_60937/g.70764  ORF Transcript_60937/g.70764 Transcript_60937/m.70764 type:complete len:242 (+) Transcript_60937:87-812(+)
MSGKKIIIFGGNGFVGSRVTKYAVEAGWNTIVACRSGAPSAAQSLEPWAHKAQYISIDALSRSQVFECLDDHPDTYAIVSCIGALTTANMEGRRLNGDATINMAAGLFERKAIRKLIFVSAADMQPVNRVLKGYYQGKRAAEKAILENLGDRGVVLRPGMIYGTRNVSIGGVSVPLPIGIVGAPMKTIFQPIHKVAPFGILTPPVSVDDVAKACVWGAEEASVHGKYDVYGINDLASNYHV